MKLAIDRTLSLASILYTLCHFPIHDAKGNENASLNAATPSRKRLSKTFLPVKELANAEDLNDPHLGTDGRRQEGKKFVTISEESNQLSKEVKTTEKGVFSNEVREPHLRFARVNKDIMKAEEFNDPHLGMAADGQEREKVSKTMEESNKLKETVKPIEKYVLLNEVSDPYLGLVAVNMGIEYAEELNDPHLGMAGDGQKGNIPVTTEGRKNRKKTVKSTGKHVFSDEVSDPYLGFAAVNFHESAIKHRKLDVTPMSMSTTSSTTTSSTTSSTTTSSTTTSSSTVSSGSAWYPDWEGDNSACVRVPREMTSAYSFKGKDECCKAFYLWNYASCVGDGTSGSKYYADWLGQQCVNDGRAPSYMVNNPSALLHDSLSDCCQKNFSWKINSCVGSITNGSGMYYPDWEGSVEGCLVDSGATLAPKYMQENPTAWMHDTLDACCAKYFTWNRGTCMGGAGTNKWYMDYIGEEKCVRDCLSGSDCGGIAESWDQLFDSKFDCCKMKNSWNGKCNE